ncbi:MAG: hypothetical protein JXB30_01305 [Anaerolineae bacterium]|nr:hypothetical protein [Anaerolineae bacterium]
MITPTMLVSTAVWALIGITITPLIAHARGRDPRLGFLLGLLAGAAAAFYLLVPLWIAFLLWPESKVCPSCGKRSPKRPSRCWSCGGEFPPDAGRHEEPRLGYPEFIPFVGFLVIAGVFLVSVLFAQRGLPSFGGAVYGALVGGVGGLLMLETLWVFVPRMGKRCPVCKKKLPASSGICPHCRYNFPDPEAVATGRSTQTGWAEYGGAVAGGPGVFRGRSWTSRLMVMGSLLVVGLLIVLIAILLIQILFPLP